MQVTDKIVVSEDVVAREVAGETVLLNLASGTYFGLDAIGGTIWQWLESGDCQNLAELAEKLIREYDVSRDDAEADLLALAAELAEHHLIALQSS